ncbi:MAG TPA: HEAT repeat domain-containing protein [Thermoanaerobaculia bacterium]|nr:HEAT repeat domain-containing protein [Thermoanaerobaculia bacterium]
MPLLLTESLDPARRELTHQHIETCDVCGEEWAAYKETWDVLGDLPEVDVPPRVKAEFLGRIGMAEESRPANVVPFHRKPAFKWVAQAAAVVVLAGGGYFFGDRNADRIAPTGARVDNVRPLVPSAGEQITPVSLAENRDLNASALSPEIQGRPNITNVQFLDGDATDNDIKVSFDVTSHWTVRGNPKEKSIVRLLSYMLENEESVTPRSNAMEWVRRTYSNPQFADPEIANALAKVLRNDEHEGVRIRAVDTLSTLPPAGTAADTRDALIQALKSDPNPAVRMKAVDALVNLARGGATFDPAMVDTLRAKASEGDENLYVRVKAAEALSNIKP